MKNLKLFEKSKPSNTVISRGPEYKDQIMAMANDEYWTILNTSLLRKSSADTELNHRVNALKCALQTYGPSSNKLPDLRQNKGKSKGFVFHGHVNDSNGLTYILEWAIIDTKNRVLTLTNFNTHENYTFRQKPIDKKTASELLSQPESIKIIKLASEKIDEAKKKVERIQISYGIAA